MASAVALAVVACFPAWAQSPGPVPAATDTPLALETMVVTGSHLPLTSDLATGRVIVLEARELAATGLDTNLLEILRKRLPAFSGAANLGLSNATTGISATMGGSQVARHNLETLVLVNGRRVAANGANGRGGYSFVDVSQIPLAAIARVEIGGDGASAVYGSDAVGGVVNIILKSDYRGAELGARFAAASGQGGYTERSAHLVVGASAKGVAVTAAMSWAKTDPLWQKDRAFSASITGQTATIAGAVGEGISFPRYFLDPALNSPRERNPVGGAATAASMSELVANGTYRDLGAAAFSTIADSFDLAPYQTLLLGQEKKSGTISATAELSGRRLVAFADYLRGETRGFSQLTAQAAVPNLTVPAGAPFNPLTSAVRQVAFRYAPAPRKFAHDAQLDRAVFGLRGTCTEHWKWEVAGGWSGSGVTQRVRNVLYGPNLERAIAGGFNAQGVATPGGAFSRVASGFSESGAFAIQPALDPFARAEAVNPAALENLLGTYVAEMRGGLRSLDFHVSGQPWRLPAGNLALVVGGDLRRETLSGLPDDNARLTGPNGRRWLGAPFFDPFSSRRTVQAGFVEAQAPLTSKTAPLPGASALDLNAAYRVERYSDFGRSRAPRVGVRWRPIDGQVTLRSTYAEASVAPPLFSLFGPVLHVFTPVAVIPGVFGVNGQARQRTGSNAELRPSRARTKSAGVTIAPRELKGLVLSLDFLRVDQRDLAGTVGAAAILQSVEQLGAASPYAGQVALGNFHGEPGARPIATAGELGTFLRAGNSAAGIFVSDTRANISGLHLNALDVNLDYTVPLAASLGRVGLRTTGTFFLDYRFQALPTQRSFEYAGHASNGGTGAPGTLPGWRFYSVAEWKRGKWSATLGHTAIPSVVDIGPGGNAFAANPAAQRRPVGGFTAWDMAVGYAFERQRATGAGGASSRGGFFKGLQLNVGINNVMNRMPPLAPQAFSDSNVDLATYPILGRLWFVSGSTRF